MKFRTIRSAALKSLVTVAILAAVGTLAAIVVVSVNKSTSGRMRKGDSQVKSACPGHRTDAVNVIDLQGTWAISSSNACE